MRPLNITSIQEFPSVGQLSVVRLLQVVKGGREMKDHEPIVATDRSRKALLSILKTVRRATWGKYLKILLLASSPSGVTMNGLSLELGEKPQTMHPLLIRMIDRGAMTREKRDVEYYYHLSSNISKEDVEALIKEIADEDVSSALGLTPLLTLDEIAEMPEMAASTEDISEEDDRAMVNRSMESQERMSQLPKLPALPEFDPNWSEARQNQWFSLYEKLIDLKRHQGND